MNSLGSLAPSRRRLWLVRHGESTWNAVGWVQGQLDSPTLTQRGRRQVRRCAALLDAQRATIGAVYSSDLRRAHQSALPIARVLQLDVRLDGRLRERSLGVVEGTPSTLLDPERSGIKLDRVVDADAAPAGGESVRDLYLRATGAVADLLARHPTGDLVLVCHGGVVRVVLAWLDGVGPDDMSWPGVENALAVCRTLEVSALAV